jgi:hypothetical protein
MKFRYHIGADLGKPITFPSLQAVHPGREFTMHVVCIMKIMHEEIPQRKKDACQEQIPAFAERND